MLEYTNSRAVRIIGPQNEVLTRDNLPPADTTRWVASRKAQVVAAVEGGLMTIDEALCRYKLSLEEFCSWQHAMDCSGVAGLRVAAMQRARHRRREGRSLPRPAGPVPRELHPA